MPRFFVCVEEIVVFVGSCMQQNLQALCDQIRISFLSGWTDETEYAFAFYSLNLQRIMLLTQSGIDPILSLRTARDILDTIVKIHTSYREVLEESQSEQDEWLQTVCGAFATIMLTIEDLAAVNFEQTFAMFFNEPAFFNSLVDMLLYR
jgi:hypothetical protein